MADTSFLELSKQTGKAMWKWLKQLDQILRGEATRPAKLSGETIDVPAAGLAAVVGMLGLAYGLCMGVYAIINRELSDAFLQMLATTIKVPALFFLTLAVTFPSLYVFNALVGSRLNAPALLRLLMAALGVNLAVLASLGPITAFFSACTTSYAFMVLLNVVFFAISGALGLMFLLQTLHRLSLVGGLAGDLVEPSDPDKVQPEEEEAESTDLGPVDAEIDGKAEEAEGQDLDRVKVEVVKEPGALERVDNYLLGKHVKTVFGCWMVVFGLVGSQMGWILRPLIGAPNMPFELFRERESNFFEAVLRAAGSFFGW